MSYDTAISALASALTGLEINEPHMSIMRVYQEPPATIEDHPAFVLFGSSGHYKYTFGGRHTPDEEHVERVRLCLKDRSPDQAVKVARKFREAVKEALRTHGGLNAQATVSDVRWDDLSAFNYGGAEFVGFDMFITFWVLNPSGDS